MNTKQRRLDADTFLSAYLSTVPRRGASVILHANAKTSTELADILEDIAVEIRTGGPRNVISSRGYWTDGRVDEWVDWEKESSAGAGDAGGGEG